MIDNCIYLTMRPPADTGVRYLNRGLNFSFYNWVYGEGVYNKLTRTDVRGWNDCYTLGVL